MEEASSGSKRTRVVALVSGLVLVMVALGAIAYPTLKHKWEAPLGPALELPTYTPSPLPSPSATSTATAIVSRSAQASPQSSTTATLILTSTHTPTPTVQPLCGGPPVMFILGIGVDTEDDTYTYGLGDAIRVARIDFVTPKVTVLSFPRDLWVEIPGISEHYGITHGKLNQSFFYGSPGMKYYDGPGGGPGLMARTLEQNFGLRVDHYGAVNMITFVRIVDAVGGIDLYLPTDVDGTADELRRENMGYFYAGQNHFTGDEALRFSRIRKGIGDFSRADHQTMVLCALRDKLLNPSVLPKIPQIIAAFKDQVITDLSLEQMSQLACLLPHLRNENLIFTSFPQELFSTAHIYSPQMRNQTFILNADNQVLREFVSQFIAGTWPSQPDQPSCP